MGEGPHVRVDGADVSCVEAPQDAQAAVEKHLMVAVGGPDEAFG
ncbi:hypothetical protein [Mycobacterium alsense]|nr:hypothetical protein [Mycobacterium alsense]